ncbi:hypothetical protein J4Q44_G00391690 [Coregonus suidteri]|uniref:Secreted protein n=1 Tax=Coregonus suidteri TaxID=861788 RepID=A0AAN8QBQ2_9TELE
MFLLLSCCSVLWRCGRLLRADGPSPPRVTAPRPSGRIRRTWGRSRPWHTICGDARCHRLLPVLRRGGGSGAPSERVPVVPRDVVAPQGSPAGARRGYGQPRRLPCAPERDTPRGVRPHLQLPGQGQAPASIFERGWPVPSAAPVVPVHIRHAGALPRAPNPPGVWGCLGRHPHQLCGRHRRPAARPGQGRQPAHSL